MGAALHLALLLSAGQFLPDFMWPIVPPRAASSAPAAVFRFAASTPGAFGSPITADTGQALTFTRASSATYRTGRITLASAAAGQFRVEPAGGLMEPASRNEFLNSPGYGTGWTTNNQNPTQNAGPAPDGTNTATFYDPTNPGHNFASSYQLPSHAAVDRWTVSSWFAPGVTSASVVDVHCLSGGEVQVYGCSTSDGAACGSYVVAVGERDASSSGVTDYRRTGISVICSSATADATGAIGCGPYPDNGGNCDVWGGQLEPLPFMTSLMPTVGTVASRATETLTAAAAGIIGAAQGSGVVTVAPLWSSTMAGADRVVLSTSGLVVSWVDASSAWRVVAGGATATSAAQTFAAGSAHTLRWRYTAGSTVCVSIDGTETCAGTVSALSPSGVVYLGGDASDGAGINFKNLKLCTTGTPCS